MGVSVYLIQSLKDGSYYTGISSNPQTRLVTHNRGGLKSTSKKKPFRLVYLKEHVNYQEARRHENSLKRKIKNIKIN